MKNPLENEKSKSRSSRMKAIGNRNDVSFGVQTASLTLRVIFTALASLMNNFGLSWRKLVVSFT